MKEDGFEFSRKSKQYERKRVEQEDGKIDIVDFLKEHEGILRNIVEHYKPQDLLISSKVYQAGELYVTKSYKINAAVYTEFQQMMIEKYPHYRIQDAIGQALVEFVTKYK